MFGMNECSEADALEDWADFDDLDLDDEDGEFFCVGRGVERTKREIRSRLAMGPTVGSGKKQQVKYSDGSIRTETVVKEVDGRVITSERQKDIKQLYDVAKAAKVGTMITCPTCKELHKKTTYHKVFCSNGKKSRKDCKSKYWNTIHPERLDRIF